VNLEIVKSVLAKIVRVKDVVVIVIAIVQNLAIVQVNVAAKINQRIYEIYPQ